MVVVEPRGAGMAFFTLRAAKDVRAAQFGMAEGELDAEMVAIAKAIIAQRTGTFDPTTYRDRYQEALQQLIEAKMKVLTVKPKEIAAPPPVIDLMAALKRSLAREASGSKHTDAAPKKANKRHLIGASRLSCCPSPGVGNGKHRPQPSPSLPPQGGANKQLSDPNSLFAGSVSTRCARRDRPEARRRPRYRKFESIPLQRRVGREPDFLVELSSNCSCAAFASGSSRPPSTGAFLLDDRRRDEVSLDEVERMVI
jgi:hypothetical protein